MVMRRPVLSADEYRARVVALAAPTGLRTRPLRRCAGRVLGAPVHALVDVPGFDNSAMDGFAVHTLAAPARLPVVGVVAAGAAPGRLEPGCATRIMTGAPLPHGAEAVVAFEDAQVDGDHVILGPVSAGQHVRARGEDTTAGAVVLPAGRTLRAADLAAAAAVGHAELVVHARPKVALVTTGDETQTPGSPLAPGQVYDSNSTYLAAALRRAGARVVARRHCPDQAGQLATLFDDLAARADLLLVAGGISAGDFDVVRDVLAQHVVHVRVKPGKPQAAGTWQGTPVIALPGNPVSVAASFAGFVRPWLDRAVGRTAVVRTARVGRAWASRAGLTQLVPVTVGYDESGTCTVAPATDHGSASHLVTSLARADAWAVVDADVVDVTVGTVVTLLEL